MADNRPSVRLSVLSALTRAAGAVRNPSGFQRRAGPVWGNGWEKLRGRHENLKIEGRPAYNDEFAKVVAASMVNLCFLRHANRDLQTCRSIELPACGGFMVHERNDEIEALLRDLREAVYFSDDDELLSLCRFWLDRKDRENPSP